ncbi:MAG: YeeE/YedE thiosulfate transporter family protein, partial [Woeseiaceae bacterium]
MKFATRWPPVPAGILIGISMLLAFVVAGRGIGASGATTRLVAWVQHAFFPAATEQSAYFGSYFADGAHPLNDYVVFLLVGLLIGSFVAAWLSGELRVEVLRGPRSSVAYRLILA